MAHTMFDPVRRLLVAILAGGSLIAGITAIAADPATPTTPGPMAAKSGQGDGSSTVEDTGVGEAGTGLTATVSARADGIAISGASRMAARPSVSATSGRRLATETTMRSPGDLVTAEGVELSAAVVDGQSSAHATVQHATYGHHDLGRLSVGCRNGVPTAERTGTDHLAGNIIVDYGQPHGHKVSGATVLVLGPGDRVTRVVAIATVSCVSPYTAPTASPTSLAPPTEPPTTSPGTPSNTPPARTSGHTPARPATAPTGADTIERRWVPRAPAPSTLTGHLTVTG